MLKRWSKRGLFSRVFLHGLFLLFVTSITFAALGALFMRSALNRRILEFQTWATPQMCSSLAKMGRSGNRRSAFDATLYSADNELIGSFVTPPLPPLSDEELRRLRAAGSMIVDGGSVHAFLCPGAEYGSYLELGPPPLPPLSEVAISLVLAILVVAGGSIPFARSIARPIGKLVRVTRAFGRGDLAARTNISRSDEVGDLARAFDDMAERLQQLIRAEKELLANVSHELRTPLARIRVVLETAQENPERAQRLLEEIRKDLWDLEQLVDSVMEAMRLDMGGASLSGGTLPARLEPTEVQGATRDAVERLRNVHPDRQVEFESVGGPLYADADPRLLRRLFDNLLDNADKYSDAESPIVVRVSGGAEVVRVEFSDQGAGIAAEDLPHIFEPFFRSDRTRSRVRGGAGLGLALSKRIVDVHAGAISVRSRSGVGTTVELTLKRSTRAARPDSESPPSH